MKRLNLPKVWGQGILFTYSGMEGENTAAQSLVGTLLGDCIGMEFKTPTRAFLTLDLDGVTDLDYHIISSDWIEAVLTDAGGKEYLLDILFVKQNVVAIRTSQLTKTKLFFKNALPASNTDGIMVYDDGEKQFAYGEKVTGDVVLGVFAYAQDAACLVKDGFHIDINQKIEEKTKFYQSLPVPAFQDADEEMVYYKCFSVMKSMLYTPEGRIHTMWSTPDRYPHKNMWLWDTAFHSVGIKYISPTLAEHALRAMISVQAEDGFIPHMATPEKNSHITQPPTLAWAILELHKYSPNKQLLMDVFDHLAAYLTWDMKNRDLNNNGLLEWVVENEARCRCGESGMDNTPRFDEATEMDCIDFSAFFANDVRCLVEIAKIIGRDQDARYWQGVYDKVKDAINEVLWDDEDKFYYDRKLSDGKLHKVKTVASFLPLFAGVCDAEKAKALVEHLNNPDEFNTAFPIPTVSKDDKTYPTGDMFRGNVWINFNYLIGKGLQEYGFSEEAEKLYEKTIETIKYWYMNDGVVYEYYDSRAKVRPARLSRKGHAVQPYLPDIRVQSIRDFSWGCVFLPDMLFDIRKNNA